MNLAKFKVCKNNAKYKGHTIAVSENTLLVDDIVIMENCDDISSAYALSLIHI